MNRVLIAGASGALGGGVIDAFLAAGWRLAGLTRREPPDDRRLTWVTADLADLEAMRRAATEAAERLGGGLEALVSLVGGYPGSSAIDDVRWDDYVAALELNLRPTVHAVIAALPQLERSRGSVVTIGAKSAVTQPARMSAYVAAKAALVAFTGSFAAEMRSRGVRANSILPGTLDTRANREAMPSAKTDRWVAPRAAGELVRFLASPESAPLTGAAIELG